MTIQPDPTMMRRRSGEFERILNVRDASEVGTLEKDGFSGTVWLATEFYAFGGAENPRVLVTGPVAERLVAEYAVRRCFTANQDRFKGAVVLTLDEATDYGIHVTKSTAVVFKDL